MKIKRLYPIIFYVIICVIFIPVVISNINTNDYLDQKQIYLSSNYWAAEAPCQLAQSFKPTLNILTRVSLYGWRNESPPNNLIVSIRNVVNGQDLTSVIIENSDISKYNSNWFDADFPDISVVPESTYYIVLTTTSGIIGNPFFWWCYTKGNPGDDLYLRGNMWLRCSCPGWLKQELSDFCFKTYGYNDQGSNLPPDKPLIDGKIYGKSGNEYDYSFVSIDPDGDNVSYSINWGDGTEEVLIGPYSSGLQVSVKHIWSEQGDYNINSKTRDVYGAESDWATLEISMPKIYIHNPIILHLKRMLERFPYFEKILKQIIK